MTNEELVALIQSGERDHLAELWAQVEKFVAMMARRRLILSDGLGGVEFDDLYNAGYLALVAAVDSFDPTAGRSFVSWLSLALKTAFAEAGGYRSQKQARDPLHRAGSTDAPVKEDSETEIGELIADPAAAQAFEDVDEAIYQEQLHAALERALSALPDNQNTTLRRRFYDGQTLDEIAAAEGVYKETVRQWQNRALRALCKERRRLAQFIECWTPYYRNWSAQIGERTTEMIVLKREKLVEQHTERKHLDRTRIEGIMAIMGEGDIDRIEDPFIRLALRLHILHGLSWQDVTSVIGAGRSASAVRDACCRYLDRHPLDQDITAGTVPCTASPSPCMER